MTKSDTDTKTECVMGVNFAGGIAYLVVVAGDLRALFDTTAKIVPATNVDEWTSLFRFGKRLADEAKALKIARVAFAAPRKAANWVYSDAHMRAALQTAAGLALHDAGIPSVSISQRSAAASIGLSARKELEEHDELAKKFAIGTDSVLHWKNRAAALAVALYEAKKIKP